MSDSKQYIGEVKIRAEMEDKISQGIKEITNDTKNLKETLEATNKALQELAGTNIKPKVDDSELDKLDKQVKKKRKISVDTDVSSTAEKKIDDLDKKIKKKSKKSTTKTKSSKKTADDKDQLDGINADKVVRSTRYGKNGKSSTSYSYTKSNGVQQNYNNNKLTSKKDTVVGDSNAAKLQNAIDKKVAQAKTLVSDSSIKQFDAKVEKLKSQYAGQDGSADVLSSLEKTVNTIHDKQASIKAELAKGSSGNLTQIASDADILNAKLNEVETTAKTLGTSLSKNLDGTTLQRTIDKIDNLVKNSDGFASKSQLEKLKTLRDSYTNSDSGITRAVNYDNSKIISNIEQEINARKKLAEVQKELQTGTYSATEAGYKNTLSKYSGQTSESLTRARESLKQFKEIREDFQKSLKDTNVSDLSDEEVERLSKNLQKMTEEEEKYKTAIKQVKAEETATLAPGVALRASNEMQSYINNNSKAWKKYKTQLEEVRDAYKNVTTEGQKLEVDAKARDLKAKISAEGLTGANIWQDTKRAVNQIAQFTGIYGMLQNVVMEIPSKVVSNVKEINDAQIELAKVASDASESQLSQYWDQAAESAKKYGATVSDVISSTADWKRLGYSLDGAKELSDMTTLLQRVGDNMTQETSSSGIISALKGFQLEADQAQHIVDVANEVANTQPIDTAGIFEAIERSASSLKAAGNTYEQGVALASAANSVIQNPEKIGTALKTIAMRIRSAETDLEEAGLDTEGMVTSTAKLRKEMLALSGVDILKDKDTFKSTYQILDELANKWSDLTDIQQADYTCLYVQKCA